MSQVAKPLMTDETGKKIAEALTQSEMTQTRIAEINQASESAKAGIQAKTEEQLARIPEVKELSVSVWKLSGNVTQLKDEISAIGLSVVDGMICQTYKGV